MSDEAVSKCGNYVVTIKDLQIQVHSRNPAAPQPRWDLAQTVSKHRENNGYERVTAHLKVTAVEWELPLFSECTKFAVCVSDGLLNLVLIFELAQPQSVVIEADPVGVSGVQWLSGPEPASGSYRNCTQLVVFLALSLCASVYSLLTTTQQFTLPKPFVDRALIHPTKNRLWSLVVTPYYHKNLISRSVFRDESSNRPVILHFWNDGTTSQLLASLALDHLPGAAASFLWSASGKWLLLFDASGALWGYLLHVYNLLGLHTRPVLDPASHTAQPVLHFCLAPSCLSAGANLAWCPVWITENDHDTIYVVSICDEFMLHCSRHELAAMLSCNMPRLSLLSGPVWSQSVDTRGAARYVEVGHITATAAVTWQNVASKGDIVVFSAGNMVVALRLGAKVQVLFTLVAALSFVGGCILSDAEVLILFTDHAVVCHNGVARIIASTDYEFTHVGVEEDASEATVNLIEERPSGPHWTIARGVFDLPVTRLTRNKHSLDEEKDTLKEEYELTDTFQDRKKRRTQVV